MSDDIVLDRFTSRVADERLHAGLRAEVDGGDDLGGFGWLRGARDHATMLELRKKDGNILAVGYGWLESAAFDPSDGITLQVGERTIQIKGRNLNAELKPSVRLFEGITRHRVPWIQEAGHADELTADADVCVIDSIEW